MLVSEGGHLCSISFWVLLDVNRMSLHCSSHVLKLVSPDIEMDEGISRVVPQRWYVQIHTLLCEHFSLITYHSMLHYTVNLHPLPYPSQVLTHCEIIWLHCIGHTYTCTKSVVIHYIDVTYCVGLCFQGIEIVRFTFWMWSCMSVFLIIIAFNLFSLVTLVHQIMSNIE